MDPIHPGEILMLECKAHSRLRRSPACRDGVGVGRAHRVLQRRQIGFRMPFATFASRPTRIRGVRSGVRLACLATLVAVAAACGEVPADHATDTPKREAVVATADIPEGAWTALTQNSGDEKALDKLATVLVLGDGNALVAGGAAGDGRGGWTPSAAVVVVSASNGVSHELPGLPGSGAVLPLGAAGTVTEPVVLVERCTMEGEQGACARGSTSVGLFRLDSKRWSNEAVPPEISEAVSSDHVAWGPGLFEFGNRLALIVAVSDTEGKATTWHAAVSPASEIAWSRLEPPDGLTTDSANFGAPICATRDHLVALTIPSTRDPGTSSVQIGDLRPGASVALASLDAGMSRWSRTSPLSTPNGLGFGYLGCNADTAVAKLNTVPSTYVTFTPGQSELQGIPRPNETLDDPMHARLVTSRHGSDAYLLSIGAESSALGRLGSSGWSKEPAPTNDGLDALAVASPNSFDAFVVNSDVLIDLRRFTERPTGGRAYALRIAG